MAEVAVIRESGAVATWSHSLLGHSHSLLRTLHIVCNTMQCIEHNNALYNTCHYSSLSLSSAHATQRIVLDALHNVLHNALYTTHCTMHYTTHCRKLATVENCGGCYWLHSLLGYFHSLHCSSVHCNCGRFLATL